VKKTLTVISSVFFFSTTIIAQSDSVYVERKECVSESSYKGYKLVIHYINDSARQTAKTYDYHLDFLQGIDDITKIKLIGLLLQYQDDTSLCCIKTYNYSFNGIEGCRGKPKDVTRYTIQVDALFMINRLCWPKLMELYSCTPVLYDNKLKKEINSDPEKIKCIFKEYREWYEECKSKGTISKYFPFNDGRYVWYGGRKSISPKD
jgi:hypothetical protein